MENTVIKSRQLLLTTSNGTFTGTVWSLEWAVPPNQQQQAASEQQEEHQPPGDEKQKGGSSQETKRWLEEIDEGSDDDANAPWNLKEEDDDTAKVTTTDASGNVSTSKDEKQEKQDDAEQKQNQPNEEEGGNNNSTEEKMKALPPVHPPLVVLVGDLLDLAEASFHDFAKNLLKFAVCSHILIPHVRGYEPSSVQKQNIRTHYSLAETAVDLLRWIDEAVRRRYAPSQGGVVLVGHGIFGSLVCEAANACFWGRRELSLRSQAGRGFWKDNKKTQQSSPSNQAENEDEGDPSEDVTHTRLFLIRGVVFLSCAPPANLLRQMTLSQLTRSVRAQPSISAAFALVWSAVMFSLFCWIALLFPQRFVMNRIDTVVKNFWTPNRLGAAATDESENISRHFHLNGTERDVLRDYAVKVKEFEEQQAKQQQQTSPPPQRPYVSSILRSRTSPPDSVARAITGHIVCFAAMFLRITQRDTFTLLQSIAEKRVALVDEQLKLQRVQEKLEAQQQIHLAKQDQSQKIKKHQAQHQRKAKDDASLLMLFQLPRVREQPPFEQVAPAVPVLCIIPEKFLSSLPFPEAQRAALAELQLLSNDDSRKLSADSSSSTSASTASSKVTIATPSCTCSCVTVLGADSYSMHRVGGTSVGSNTDKNLDSHSFLCALAVAKFIRRGMLHERVLLAKWSREHPPADSAATAPPARKPKKIAGIPGLGGIIPPPLPIPSAAATQQEEPQSQQQRRSVSKSARSDAMKKAMRASKSDESKKED